MDNGRFPGLFRSARLAAAWSESAYHYDHPSLQGTELPQADAIVIRNRQGCRFGSGNLAGVGVHLSDGGAEKSFAAAWLVFYTDLVVPNVADYLDLVALGTVRMSSHSIVI